jgi:hypothetical protein
MRKLGTIAKVLRSKNAGPLVLTLDIMFGCEKDYERVKTSGVLTGDLVARLYQTKKKNVKIIYYDIVRSIKISFPRKQISGAPGDDDVYGCQQHIPLYNVRIQ